jgi:hypothetical protein
MHNRSNLLIDSLCYLVANKENTEVAIKEFFRMQVVLMQKESGAKDIIVVDDAAIEAFIHKQDDFNLNDRGSKGLTVVETAAMSGSVSSLRYLIEDCEVDIKADEDTPNLVERALKNPAARAYLLNPETFLWLRFNDGTTNFLAHVMAGRLKEAQNILEENPNHICDHNIRFQNALHWSQLTNENEAWMKDNAEKYFQQNYQHSHFTNLARFHACMGHFNRLRFPNKPEAASRQFDLSLESYKKAIATCSRLQDAYGLKIELATNLLFCGRMHVLMKGSNLNAATFAIKASEECLNDAIKIMRSLPKDLVTANSYLYDALLREHAENCFMLDDIFYANGDSLSLELLDAIDFYKKSVSYGEEAVRSADEISNKTPKDQAYMKKYCDKLSMSYGAIEACHRILSKRKTDAAKFHKEEKDRYAKIASDFLNNPEKKPPGKLVPARLTPKNGVKPITTNGYTNGHTNGTNGFLRSPNKQGIFLSVSPKLPSSPILRSGKALEDELNDFLLPPPTLSAMAT